VPSLQLARAQPTRWCPPEAPERCSRRRCCTSDDCPASTAPASRSSCRLVSIGEEREKGNALTLEAHELLAAEVPGFAGNIEGTELLAGGADVVVCDGFTGNVALKTIEGTIAEVSAGLREEVLATWSGRLGGLLIRPASRRLRSRLDPDTHGGGYLLGLRGLVVVAHGSSSHRAIANAIRLAAKGVDHRIVERLRERMPERVVESSRSTTPI
jgi:fatty acid/phospholipid biosynthesis enzyme